jgi:hypothetical protein
MKVAAEQQEIMLDMKKILQMEHQRLDEVTDFFLQRLRIWPSRPVWSCGCRRLRSRSNANAALLKKGVFRILERRHLSLLLSVASI